MPDYGLVDKEALVTQETNPRFNKNTFSLVVNVSGLETQEKFLSQVVEWILP